MTQIVDPESLKPKGSKRRSLLDQIRTTRASATGSADSRLNALRSDISGTPETDTDYEEVREDVEQEWSRHIQYYDYGKHETSDGNAENMRRLNPTILVGSVDSDGFKMEWHRPRWYKPFISAAAEITKCYEILDPSTKEWFDSLKPAIDVFVDFSAYSERDYRRKHRREIFKIVKKHGGKMIYGSKGLFNFLLAFNRTKNICPKLSQVTEEGFDLADLEISTIKLVVGPKGGKVKGKDHRYAYMLVRNTPEFGSDEFFERYMIAQADRARFLELYSHLEPWLSGEVVDLSDKAYFSSLSIEEGQGVFFTTDRNSIGELIELLRDRSYYAEFFEDSDNPEALKWQSLYYYALKRSVEFYTRYADEVEAAGGFLELYERDELKTLHIQSRYICGRLLNVDPNNKEVLQTMLDSTNYMIDNEAYVGDNELERLGREKKDYLARLEL